MPAEHAGCAVSLTIRNAPSSDSQDPGDLSAIFGGHENADRIAAELEKL